MNTVLIPMAGLGSRFTSAGFDTPKPLIKIGHKTLIEYSIDSLGLKNWRYIVVARKFDEDSNEELKRLLPFVEFIWIDQLTGGAADTCMFAEELINKDSQLIVTNCDQFLDWKPYNFLNACQNYDAAVLTYESSNPKNSFARVHDGKVVDIVEKEVISNDALVGVHWWSRAELFFKSAKKAIGTSKKNQKEAFISETYIPLIDDKVSIGAIPIEGTYWCIGTPDDLKTFKGYFAEFMIIKPSTFFIDLDGTILMHEHKYSELSTDQSPCPNVVDTLNEIDSRGDKIILVSARKESSRKLTEDLLRKIGIPFDQLILGVNQGPRILINDVIADDSPRRAIAKNVIMNKGFKYDEIEEY